MSARLLNKKAQSVMIDLVIGLALFLVILAVGITVLDNRVNALREQQELLQQQKSADNALSQLISTTGISKSGETNWEGAAGIDDVKFIGLALTDRIILPVKINKFIEYANSSNHANYEETKAKLLIGYDFYFRLVDPETNSTLKGCPDSGSSCEAGKQESYLIGTEGKKIGTIIKSRRIAAFNGVSTIAEITVFRTQ